VRRLERVNEEIIYSDSKKCFSCIWCYWSIVVLPNNKKGKALGSRLRDIILLVTKSCIIPEKCTRFFDFENSLGLLWTWSDFIRNSYRIYLGVSNMFWNFSQYVRDFLEWYTPLSTLAQNNLTWKWSNLIGWGAFLTGSVFRVRARSGFRAKMRGVKQFLITLQNLPKKSENVA
jgi:hypothetical protein